MTRLIPVLYKRTRIVDDSPNPDATLKWHTFKCFGAVLNPDAVRGRGYVVRRVVGQDAKAVMGQLAAIARGAHV